MTDLSEFLLARIAEDEEDARAATTEYGAWDMDDELWDGEPWEVMVFPERGGSTTIARTWRTEQGKADATHIARWDPARVLAECEAKRAIIRLHESWPVLVEAPLEFDPPDTTITELTMRVTRRMAWLTQQEYRARFGSEPPTTPMLRVLALPYADHPDYREEWKP